MEQNSQINQKEKLESQIREAYGRVVYSQTTQEKHYQRLRNYSNYLYWIKITLSGITACSVITTIFGDLQYADIFTTFVSLGTFIVNALFKEKNYIAKAEKHRETADILWGLREDYKSLLVDLEILNLDEIRNERDSLKNKTERIYKEAPRTDSKSYKEAQKAIKLEEEQTFSEDELDDILPESIRRRNSKD